MMEKLSFNISELVDFYKGASFRKIDIVTGDTKKGVKVHRVVDNRDRRGRTRGCVVDR